MKPIDRYYVWMSFASFASAFFIGGLGFFLLTNDGSFSLVKNTLSGIKICIGATCIQCIFTLCLHWIYKPNDYGEELSLSICDKSLISIKCLGFLLIASFVFHAIEVLFGAPFIESVAETYHFALLLTAQVCLPLCLFFGADLDAWLKVLTENVFGGPLELMILSTSVGAIMGAWLGAVPIPLDWDRPWQEWPISCVAGSLLGYTAGLSFASFFIPRQLRMVQKSKFF